MSKRDEFDCVKVGDSWQPLTGVEVVVEDAHPSMPAPLVLIGFVIICAAVVVAWFALMMLIAPPASAGMAK